MRTALSALMLSISIAPSATSAGYVTLYGGPTYDAATQTGYQSPGLPVSPGRTAGNGIAVGYAHKYIGGTDLGPRALRWDASGNPATELGGLGTSSSGFQNIYGYAVNNAGAAVGSAYKYAGGPSLGQRAVRWDASTATATELGSLGTNSSGQTSSEAFAINTAGVAVGFATKYVGDLNFGQRAVRWDASSTAATELRGLGTCNNCTSVAWAVNDAGTAVGQAEKYSGNAYFGTLAVRWDASGTSATELGTIGADSSGYAYNVPIAVNTAGTVVGFANMYVGNAWLRRRAVRWDGSGTAATELGNLGTDSFGITNSIAYAVNDAGTAVGYAEKYAGGTYLGERAVRWDASTTAAAEFGNLGTDNSGFTRSETFAVNTAGIAVGYAEKYAGGTLLGSRATLWDLDGVAFDLNNLIDPNSGWTLTEASGISDTNWVTGYGSFDPDGAGGQTAYQRMYLMQLPAATSLPGDFNLDGTVDAADYVVWRKNPGAIYMPNDYNTWRANFGRMSGSAAAVIETFVPEPLNLALLALGLSAVVRRPRCRHRQRANHT